MKLFKGCFSDEYVWEEDVVFEENFDAYILYEDVREFYMDDESADIELYYEVEINQATFVKYCRQERLQASSGKVLNEFMRRCNE